MRILGMKIILSLMRRHYAAIVSVFLVTAALIITGMAGSYHLSQNLEIRTWYDLDAVKDNLRGNHTLMNDLDSTTPGYTELASPTANQGKGWDPIGFRVVVTYGDGFEMGRVSVTWYKYTGTFDGQGYEIRDLFINRPDENYAGLFYTLGDEGVIKDIGVVNVTVTGYFYVGGLVGGNDGNVSNSYSTGSVTGYHGVGGLVGGIGGTVINSYSTGNVIGHSNVGGLVGRIYYGATLSDSHSTGTVTGDKWVGGLVGDIYRSTVSNSYSTGNVIGDSHVGGLVGYNSHGNVRNSYSTGSVSGTTNVGGLVGNSNVGAESNSFWDTQTSGQATSAGGTGKTTAEMQDIITFSGAMWDIIAVAPGPTNTTYIWNIVNGVTYPFLSWQP